MVSADDKVGGLAWDNPAKPAQRALSPDEMDQLCRQARQAAERVVRRLEQADRAAHRRLLRGVSGADIYRAAMTLVMRVLALSVVEVRGLLRQDDAFYTAHFGIQALHEKLRRDAEEYGERGMAARHDGYRRLFATFRAMSAGVLHAEPSCPTFGASLFDPERYPFLEGRCFLEGCYGDSAQAAQVVTEPPLDDATTLRLLDALMTLGAESPAVGSVRQGQLAPLLSAEQIGHVYEALLDQNALRASEPMVGLVGSNKREVVMPLAELEALYESGEEALLAGLHAACQRSARALALDLHDRTSTEREAAVRRVCGDDAALCQRLRPFIGLMYVDPEGQPGCYRVGAVYLVLGGQRRSMGAHYTPARLTEPMVLRALQPLVYLGKTAGRVRDDWTLRSAQELLALRICDTAVGSGAFLLEACRYLAERVLEAWETASGDEAAHAGADWLPLPKERSSQRVLARHLVAEQCLYGVDRDPLAVEMAKLCLWLFCQSPERPHPWLEGHLVCGNALLGIVSSLRQSQGHFYPHLRDAGWACQAAVDAAIEGEGSLRMGLAQIDGKTDLQLQHKQQTLERSRGALHDLISLGDRSVAEVLTHAPKVPRVQAALSALAGRLEASGEGIAGAAEQARQELRDETQVLYETLVHWPLAFPEVFSRSGAEGFDAVIGNPPWVAYAGRAAQPLEPALRSYYLYASPAFHGYRTLQGVFVHRAAQLLRPAGRLALVLPTSVADLHGYRATRRAHDALCEPDAEMIDFGDGAFEGVFQPAMGLLSTRRTGEHVYTGQPVELGDDTPHDEGWLLARDDLDAASRSMLERLTSRPTLSPASFGERGYQTTRSDRALFQSEASEAHLVALRSGGDIDAFTLKPASHYVDPTALSGRFRAADEWRKVDVLIRQTARFPIATVADGVAFRNSILAGFAVDGWSAYALAGYLNTTPIRWLHYHLFRDARQGMPQVKIGHLRRIVAPSSGALNGEFEVFAKRLAERGQGMSDAERRQLDTLVGAALGLSEAERLLIESWWQALS